VIEGRLSQIQVAGLRAFSKENILRSLPALQTGQTPHLGRLDSELLMANENPAKTARVIFQPGEKRAQVEALAIVEEQAIEQWNASLDNTGNRATGESRLALAYRNANVRDGDNVLMLRLITSPSDPSKVAIASTSLRVPLYAQLTFLEWSALLSNTRNAPNQTPAGDLRFSGKGYALGARAIRLLPSLGERKQQLSVGLESRQYKNNCSLGEFGEAGCGSAGASVSVFPMTLGYALQKPGVFQSSVQWVKNLALGSADRDFNASRAGANSHYALLRANASGLWPLAPDWQMTWRADTQLTGQPLVSAEQFGAGGIGSVRGYRERVLSGDSGLALSVEAQMRAPNFLRSGDDWGVSQIAVFLDGGMVSNQLAADCQAGHSSCRLWGTGLGLVASMGKDTTARADLARAGTAINETPVNDWRLHFRLNHTF
jgi:hemolysin activation/secretion protein